MSRLLLLALGSLAATAAAQAPAPAPRQIRIDVSPAGEVVVKRYLGTRDPFIVQRLEQLRGLAQQIASLANAPKLDLARLQALMRQQEALQAAVQRRGNDRTLAMLRELSENDRIKFARSFRSPQPAAKPPGGQ